MPAEVAVNVKAMKGHLSGFNKSLTHCSAPPWMNANHLIPTGLLVKWLEILTARPEFVGSISTQDKYLCHHHHHLQPIAVHCWT